jgi:hypothetical protein
MSSRASQALSSASPLGLVKKTSRTHLGDDDTDEKRSPRQSGTGGPQRTPGVITPYPVCPSAADGSGPATSLRQRCLAPEMVERWAADMNFTEAQRETITAFREGLLAEGLLAEWWDNVPSLSRWLVARKWNLTDASNMFRNHVEYRQRMQLDDWVPTAAGPVPRFLHEFKFPEMDGVKKAYPFVHHRCAKNGMPVYFDRLGQIEFGNMIKGSSTERVLKYFAWYCEASLHWRFPGASVECGKFIGKGMYVMDLKGFSPFMLNSATRAFLQAFIKNASDNYPEVVSKTYIINAPLIFRGTWAVVSKWIDDNTVAKFSILGGQKEYLPKLLQVSLYLPISMPATLTTPS